MTSSGMTMTADVATPMVAAAVVRAPVEGGEAVSVAAEPAGKGAGKAAATAPVDMVEISNKSQKPKQEPANGETVKREAQRRPTDAQRKMGDILFIYNLKGDVRVRFMDSSNMLIYQTPPVMLSKMMDLMQSFGSFVNIKV